MNTRRAFSLRVRRKAALVLGTLGVVAAFLLTRDRGLELGIYVGVGGFLVIAIGMLLIVGATRDSGL
ncbi:MAG: hypothetical protein ABEJ35_05985 [Halobacteriaceae archaeon]